MITSINEWKKINEDATQLRTLTTKSKLKFGKFADILLDNLVSTQKKYLRWVYYNCSNINYMPDIIKNIGIPEDYVIVKPGKNEELGKTLEKTIKTEKDTNLIQTNLLKTFTKNKVKNEVDKERNTSDTLGGYTNFKYGKHVGRTTPGVTPAKNPNID